LPTVRKKKITANSPSVNGLLVVADGLKVVFIRPVYRKYTAGWPQFSTSILSEDDMEQKSLEI
jgi:hypothetical protein